jgi:hypothetical protein
VSRLSELLTEANTGQLSARSISRAAQAAGFTLNHDTAARYLRGDHGRPDEQTLVAFGKVLRVSLARLRAAASLPTEATEPYRPPAEASRLNRRQRRAVDEVIRAMLEQAPAQVGIDVGARRGRRGSDPAAVGQLPKAARRGRAEPPTR